MQDPSMRMLCFVPGTSAINYLFSRVPKAGGHEAVRAVELGMGPTHLYSGQDPLCQPREAQQSGLFPHMAKSSMRSLEEVVLYFSQVRHWNRQIVDSPSLEGLKASLDRALV